MQEKAVPNDSPPTGTLTFLFTDIEGSTTLYENYPTQMQAALIRHEQILRNAIEEHSGYIFKTVGDAFCCAFSTAREALETALASQRALFRELWPENIELRVRMALHTGAGDKRDGDYFGPTLNRVTRLLSVAHGGQILLSEAAYTLVRDHLVHLEPEGELRDLGELRLKDLKYPEHIFQLVVPDLPKGFPPLKTQMSTQGALKDETAGTRRHNLPSALTSFVGRGRELSEVKHTLAMSRLLTLTGTGGSGKTRLALEVARDLVEVYPDGVWLVELAGLWESELVCQQVADVLGVREQPGRLLLSTLKEALQTKKLLLVVDNCEHLIEACARLVETLLSFCPDLRVLATSREALGTSGEVIFRVPSLSLPEGDELTDVTQFMRCESVRLFVERARYRDPAFVLTQQNAKAVVEICRRLDGVPLAIELAAARVGTLDVEQISKRLSDSLRFLTTGSRTAPLRHQTLRGALDWSYELLSESEQALFRRLSVFAGGWTLEAAEVVGAGDSIQEADILDLLGRLVEKSLIVAEAEGEGALRYRMLEPVRQYAWKTLQESGEAEVIQRRHGNLFLTLAEEAEPSMRGGGQQKAWLELLEREHDNLRRALSRAFDSKESQVGVGFVKALRALAIFWYMHGHFSEGRRWLEAVLASENTSPYARVRALTWSGFLLWVQGLYQQARDFSEEGLKLAEELRDELGTADALYNLGVAAMVQLNLGPASALLERSLSMSRTLKDESSVSRTLYVLGHIALWKRDYAKAAKLYEEGLAVARKAEDQLGIAFSLHLGAHIARHRGEYQLADTLCTKGLKLCRSSGMWPQSALHLHVKALLEGARGRLVRAARLWGAAEAIHQAISVELHPCESRAYAPHIIAARTQLGEAAWEAAWAEGKAMTQEAAIEYALSEKELASSPESEATSSGVREDVLSRREQEVAVLLSRGLTNRRIAKELLISERTADPHEFEHITLVRLLIAQGEHREALGLLERLLEAAEAGGRGGSVIEILVLKALALQAQNDTPNALAALQRALSLAEPEGYVRTFVDEGAPMATLLKQLLKTYKTQQPSAAEPEVSLEYVRKLLEALGEEVMVVTKVPHARGKAGLLVEPITERELEVLRLLASDFSNREIAKKLYVSLDTVKSHLKHIYGKLGARSRYQAVDRARELDLLQ